MVKVGINGFGRIGRNVLRAALGNPDLQIVAINDLTDSKTLAHLLKHDSLLGKLPAPVEAGDGALQVDGQRIVVFSERDPANIPWRDAGVDVVIEATGFFTEREKAAVHITHGGAKRVIISAPGKNDDLTIVMGVNHDQYDPARHAVVSNGSCTTNGLAPAAQVLHQQFGIEHGLMNTTHAYTKQPGAARSAGERSARRPRGGAVDCALLQRRGESAGESDPLPGRQADRVLPARAGAGGVDCRFNRDAEPQRDRRRGE